MFSYVVGSVHRPLPAVGCFQLLCGWQVLNVCDCACVYVCMREGGRGREGGEGEGEGEGE